MLNVDEITDLRTKIDKSIAILCQRYVYRGILKNIYPNYLVLDKCCAVEHAGRSEKKETEKEDYIEKPIRIFVSRIELIYEPKWANAPRKIEGNC